MAAVNIKPVLYVDRYGNEYAMGVDAALYAQADGDGDSKLGGPIPATGITGIQKFPAGAKPRRIRVKNPAGKIRYVPVLTTTAELATNPAATVSLEDSNNTATTYTADSDIIPEYFGKSFANA